MRPVAVVKTTLGTSSSSIQEGSHLHHILGDEDGCQWSNIEKILEDKTAEVRFSALLALCALGAAPYSLMNAVFC